MPFDHGLAVTALAAATTHSAAAAHAAHAAANAAATAARGSCRRPHAAIARANCQLLACHP